MILDERARRLLNAVGVYTHPLPGTRPGPYLGSQASTPLWGDLVRMADRQRRADPDAYRLINLGVGLEEISLPVSFALPEPARVARAAHGLVGGQPAHGPVSTVIADSAPRCAWRTNASTWSGGSGLLM
jgi:hypothetical protein